MHRCLRLIFNALIGIALTTCQLTLSNAVAGEPEVWAAGIGGGGVSRYDFSGTNLGDFGSGLTGVDAMVATGSEVWIGRDGGSGPIMRFDFAGNPLGSIPRRSGTRALTPAPNTRPVIVRSPTSQAATVGESVVFVVKAQGIGTLSFQWRRDGVDLIDDGRVTGATTSNLQINPAWLTDTGLYDVVVTRACHDVTSDPASLTVVGIIGDLNCDGGFNGGDIDPFFLVLRDTLSYIAQYPHCDHMLADMNGDGFVNGADIDPFFACLGGNCL